MSLPAGGSDMAQPPSSEDAANRRVDTIRVMTLNVGLLRLRFLGLEVFSYPSNVQDRLPHIPEAIRKQRPDIVCLQECYEEAHAQHICSALQDELPHRGRRPEGGSGGNFSLKLKLHNGLLVLSHWPITSAEFEPYRQASWMERAVVVKGQLIVDIDVPGLSTGLRVVNLHTTSAGPHPERTDAVRDDQIAQAAERGAEASKVGRPTLIIGDLNAGPDKCLKNYQRVLESGFRDAWVEAEGSGRSEAGPTTWDPANPLNAAGPHRSCPPQRLDHMFLPLASGWPEAHMDDFVVSKARVCCQECVAPSKMGRLTVSDHYGVTFEISRKK